MLGKSILFAAKGEYERALQVLALVRNDPSTRSWRDSLPLALRLMEQLQAHFGEATYNALYEQAAKLNWRKMVNELVAEVAEGNA